MGKDVHDDGGACCHACERWAGGAEAPVPAPVPAATDSAIAPGTLALEIRKRGETAGMFAIEAEQISIGRADKCTLTIKDGALSRVQAHLVIRDGKLYVIDSKSTCGTYVDGRKTTSATRVREGSVISFGNHDLKVVRRPA